MHYSVTMTWLYTRTHTCTCTPHAHHAHAHTHVHTHVRCKHTGEHTAAMSEWNWQVTRCCDWPSACKSRPLSACSSMSFTVHLPCNNIQPVITEHTTQNRHSAFDVDWQIYLISHVNLLLIQSSHVLSVCCSTKLLTGNLYGVLLRQYNGVEVIL